LFWIIVIVGAALLGLLFFDSIRENPLPAFFVFAVGVFFLWRVVGFLTGSRDNDPLIWKIIGVTTVLLGVVGGTGKWLEHRRRRK
jgi:hypothetical protein